MQPQPGGAIAVALAADCIELGPERHPEHSFAATVEAVAYYGNHSDVRISVAGCLLRCRVGDGRRYRRGQKVSGRATAAAVHLER